MELNIKYKNKLTSEESPWIEETGITVDTSLLYYNNGYAYHNIRSWSLLLDCMKNNFPIIVLQEPPEPTRDGGLFFSEFTDKINFVLNPSFIAVVYPVGNGTPSDGGKDDL